MLYQMPHFNLVVVRTGVDMGRFALCALTTFIEISGALGPNLKFGNLKGVVLAIH